ncbi:phospholipid transport system substrate-binding protein [Sulfuritortus calidifontis]|uniref:Phospholipid transport system substrate-binding protein n=1 Tax=Sulfuritortus calidifontis TaxID=1914471 RepID=A0A4V6NYS1_9PROT|nr:ABC transporter substrate-binding protein [Sulfuritortus calidifontis]TCS72917.1 phospholipid transport system substrate-binding protein [Sulfuritortus calidifontis]
MINVFRFLILMAAVLLPGLASANAVAPDALVKDTTNEVVRIVKQDKDIKSGNRQKIYALVEAKVLPHFDFRQMTQLAVGKNWRQASPDEQQQLTREFKALLVRTYSAAISAVADYKIEFKPLKMQPGETDVLVSTEVSRSGTAPVVIDYRLEKQADGWKVYDVMVDNVSLVTTYRNSFNSEVRKNGIQGLIQSLVRRNQNPSSGS